MVEVKFTGGVVRLGVIENNSLDAIIEHVKSRVKDGGAIESKSMFYKVRFFGKNAVSAQALALGAEVLVRGELTSFFNCEGDVFTPLDSIAVNVIKFSVVEVEIKQEPQKESLNIEEKKRRAIAESNARAKLDKEDELARELGLPEVEVR